eukprot:TRINITY_DN74507_c0_g1_i1.p1 TRINITY_DN74507_c0_g1~~TRINITY_DN74507_c0_g1_i1.p1  ORF type:complete len:626 (+),score=96.10 TRINITY_DN74507_c0_g1_i1:291-2168(+)
MFDPISRLLFPMPSPSYDVYSFPEDLIWVPKSLDPKDARPEDCVPCLFLPYNSARFIVMYLHSNAEDIGRCRSFCHSIRVQFQVHVLAVEYPGYGICPGGPCDETKATENSFTAFRFIKEVLNWPMDSIIVLGRSIGCGPAISIGVEYNIAGVVVVSPMLSLREVFRDVMGPLAYAVTDRCPSKDRVPSMKSALLVVHGQKDVIIPFRHGVELYKACRTRKLFVGPQDMEHNTNLLADISYLVLPMLQFFSLPDYCFDDMNVPSWVYDKRMCPYWSEDDVKLGPGRSPAQPPFDEEAGGFTKQSVQELALDRESTVIEEPQLGCLSSMTSNATPRPNPDASIVEKILPTIMSPLIATRDLLRSPRPPLSSREPQSARGPSVWLPRPSQPVVAGEVSADVPLLAKAELELLGKRTASREETPHRPLIQSPAPSDFTPGIMTPRTAMPSSTRRFLPGHTPSSFQRVPPPPELSNMKPEKNEIPVDPLLRMPMSARAASSTGGLGLDPCLPSKPLHIGMDSVECKRPAQPALPSLQPLMKGSDWPMPARPLEGVAPLQPLHFESVMRDLEPHFGSLERTTNTEIPRPTSPPMMALPAKVGHDLKLGTDPRGPPSAGVNDNANITVCNV